MDFILFTDYSCNLSCETLAQNAVRVVPLTYQIGEESYTCYEENVPFDGKAFFERLRGKDHGGGYAGGLHPRYRRRAVGRLCAYRVAGPHCRSDLCGRPPPLQAGG